MVRGDSDLQSIDLSLARQNGAGNNLLRYGIDSRTELQKRDVGQCLESLLGHLRVAISCFIDDVLRSHQFVVRSLRFPPPTCEVLSRSRDDVGADAGSSPRRFQNKLVASRSPPAPGIIRPQSVTPRRGLRRRFQDTAARPPGSNRPRGKPSAEGELPGIYRSRESRYDRAALRQ